MHFWQLSSTQFVRSQWRILDGRKRYFLGDTREISTLTYAADLDLIIFFLFRSKCRRPSHRITKAYDGRWFHAIRREKISMPWDWVRRQGGSLAPRCKVVPKTFGTCLISLPVWWCPSFVDLLPPSDESPEGAVRSGLVSP